MNSIEKSIYSEVGYPTYQPLDACMLNAISTTYEFPKNKG
jgi:hypothetical protein